MPTFELAAAVKNIKGLGPVRMSLLVGATGTVLGQNDNTSFLKELDRLRRQPPKTPTTLYMGVRALIHAIAPEISTSDYLHNKGVSQAVIDGPQDPTTLSANEDQICGVFE